LRRLFYRALWLRIIAAIVIHYSFDETTFAPDQTTYHMVSDVLAQSWSAPYFMTPGQLINPGPKAYYYIVGTIYYLFGAWSLLPKLANAALGAFTVPVIYDLARRITNDERVAFRSATYVAYFPSLVLWSVLNIRDVWIIFLILLSCRQALALQEHFRFFSLVVLVGSIYFLVQFRDYILFPVTLPLLVSFFVRGRGHLFRNAALGMLAAAAIIYADQAAGARRLRSFDLEELQEIRHWGSVGAASGFEEADISTTGGAITFLPKGLALFLLAPFPWMLSSIRQVLAVPETLFFYSLLPALVRGMIHLIKNHLSASLMVIMLTVGMTFGYALGEGNAGTAYRHRAQMLPFYLMFAAVGIEATRRSRDDADMAMQGARTVRA
jgi:hypothetical protein